MHSVTHRSRWPILHIPSQAIPIDIGYCTTTAIQARENMEINGGTMLMTTLFLSSRVQPVVMCSRHPISTLFRANPTSYLFIFFFEILKSIFSNLSTERYGLRGVRLYYAFSRLPIWTAEPMGYKGSCIMGYRLRWVLIWLFEGPVHDCSLRSTTLKMRDWEIVCVAHETKGK